jgi:hypothetical protein
MEEREADFSLTTAGVVRGDTSRSAEENDGPEVAGGVPALDTQGEAPCRRVVRMNPEDTEESSGAVNGNLDEEVDSERAVEIGSLAGGEEIPIPLNMASSGPG